MNLKYAFLGISLASAFSLIQSASADTYPVILHGKVVMEDGSPPPVVVSIERVCSDSFGSMPGTLTDKKGEYIWRMNIDPLETRNCVIRATHAARMPSTMCVVAREMKSSGDSRADHGWR